MASVAETHADKLLAEMSALRHEKASLLSKIKESPSTSDQKLEAMIRYSYVVSEIRKVATGMDRWPKDF